MSFHSTATPSSRVKKFRKHPSPFAQFPRPKPLLTPKASQHSEDDEELFDDLLNDVGLVKALATDMTLRDVPQAIMYIRGKMWTAIPEQRAGMNSTQIAEILNFRASLPPVVTVAHVQALLRSPTMVEREIAELVQEGTVRKLVVAGRDECLVLVRDMDSKIQQSSLEPRLKNSFISLLHEYPTAQKLCCSWLSKEDAKALVQAGFLNHATRTWTPTDAFSRPGDGARGTAISICNISRAASGSIAAVGGEGVIHESGGSGGGARQIQGDELSITIPGIGSILKILMAARLHLTSLLAKSKTREMPEYMLRERWEGGVATNKRISTAKWDRGEIARVLPGRTRKWKQHYGLAFECVLGEALGAGMLEVFDTSNKAVGRGVRLLQTR